MSHPATDTLDSVGEMGSTKARSDVLGCYELQALLSRVACGVGFNAGSSIALPYHIGHPVPNEKQEFDNIGREGRYIEGERPDLADVGSKTYGYRCIRCKL